ncbi:MAG TPA: cellulose binding domain-containing protein, partial [Polyangiaceae bacterium]
DVDCGGSCAPTKKCADGRRCSVAGDCQNANCVNGVCQPASSSGLKVQYACIDPTVPNDAWIQPALSLVNLSSTAVPYTELKVRYWYTSDTAGTPVFHCYGASAIGGCTFMTSRFVVLSPVRSGADRYLEIGFTTTGSLAAGAATGLLQTAVEKSDGSLWNEANDYSYDPTKAYPTFSDWTHVTLYRNGTLVWGVEP